MPPSVRWSETDNDSGLIAEIALVLVAVRKTVAEARQHKIKLRRPNGKRFGHGNIDPTTDDKVERIVAGVGAADTGRLTSLDQILISIGVSAAKQGLHERLEMFRAEFQN